MLYCLIVFAGCAVGSGLNMVCGFGIGILCQMFLPYIMGSTMASSALINIITLVQAIWLAIRYRRHIHWKLLLVPVITYLIFSVLAIRSASRLANDTMRIMLGVVLLLLCIWFLLMADRIHIRGNVRNGLIAGGLGGVMSGLFAIGGPPVSVYFSAAVEEKEEYQGTIQAYFVITNAFVTALRAVSGYITKQVLLYALIGLAGMAAGTVLGTTVFKRMNVSMIRRAIYILMGVSGLIMLFE